MNNASNFSRDIYQAKKSANQSKGIQSVSKNDDGVQFNYKDKTGYWVEKPKLK